MIQNYAWQFFLLGQFVEDTRRELGIPNPPAIAPEPLVSPGISALAALSSPTTPRHSTPILVEWLSEAEKKDTKKLLDIIAGSCRAVSIINVQGEIDRIKDVVEYQKKAAIIIHFDHLKARISEELQRSSFVHVMSDRAQYYKKPELFGANVGKKLPKTIEDITNGGTCFALAQYTACVFHLMRVMEHCVQRFGKKLKIQIDPLNSSWYEITQRVHDAIKLLPGGRAATQAQKNRKQRLAMAATRLDHVRLVWRNDVMHPKATYDEAEAREVLDGVKAFVNSVADLV